MAAHEKHTCVQYRNINYDCKKVLECRSQVTAFFSVFLHQKTLKPSKAKKGLKLANRQLTLTTTPTPTLTLRHNDDWKRRRDIQHNDTQPEATQYNNEEI